MKRSVSLLFAVTVLMAMTGVVQAGEITGSMPLAGLGVTLGNGTDLSDTTLITDAFNEVSGIGNGDYSIVPPYATFFTGASLDLNAIASGGGFTVSNATWGTFAPDFGLIVGLRSANFLDVYLRGLYTPGPGFGGSVTGDVSSFELDFTFNGGSVSGGGTLNSPAVTPPGVPEPGTLLLIGAGLGLLGYRRRRAA